MSLCFFYISFLLCLLSLHVNSILLVQQSILKSIKFYLIFVLISNFFHNHILFKRQAGAWHLLFCACALLFIFFCFLFKFSLSFLSGFLVKLTSGCSAGSCCFRRRSFESAQFAIDFCVDHFFFFVFFFRFLFDTNDLFVTFSFLLLPSHSFSFGISLISF